MDRSLVQWITASLVLFIASLIAAKLLRLRYRRALRITTWLSGIALAVLVMSYLGPRLITPLYRFRPEPAPADRLLFQGVRYIQDVRGEPRPLVIHVVIVDLTTPGLQFLVTPPDRVADHQLRARTTSEFLDELDVQIAVNGDFFAPWWDNSLLDYYPYSGNPVSVTGFAASRGDIYSMGGPNYPTLYLSEDNLVSFGFDAPAGGVYNAITGNVLFLVDGIAQDEQLNAPYHRSPHPRTAVALDLSGRILMLFVVDGRQQGYSEGISMHELAEVVVGYGGVTAINLDGGGSSALVMEGENGEPVLLSAPIHNHVPYRERPVANHLGIYAPSLGD
jgi:hypothetical protein